MPRRMSCSMTVDAVLARTKTVTRRHVDTWRDLKPGARLTLIEKGMGLPKGARQVVLAEVEIVDVTVEPVGFIHMEGEDGCAREGLPDMTPDEFVAFWCAGHGYGRVGIDDAPAIECRRIEWRYLDHPVELPTCPKCGRTVVANLCGAHPDSQASADAIAAVLLAAHDRLVHAEVPASEGGA